MDFCDVKFFYNVLCIKIIKIKINKKNMFNIHMKNLEKNNIKIKILADIIINNEFFFIFKIKFMICYYA